MARSTNQISAQVVDTSTAYNESVDRNGNILPRGTIRFRAAGSSVGSFLIEEFAVPLDASEINIPLIGEHVLVMRATSPNRGALTQGTRYYYTKIINIHDNVNANKLPGDSEFSVTNNLSNYQSGGITNDSYIPTADNDFSHMEQRISSLQPYEGDKIFQSRYGSAIRFSSTILGNRSVYGRSPAWGGTRTGDAIITLTAGLQTTDEFYTTENPRADAAFIYLCSNQSIDFATANPITRIIAQDTARYRGPQIIASSDRIILNSKTDQIYLSGNRNVTIATPNWQTPMDDFFTNVDDLETQVNRLSQQLIALTAQVTTLATAVTAFAGAQAAIAAGAVVYAPLAPALTALSAASSPIVGTTTNISTQLTNVQAELTKIKGKLSTLKQ